MKNIKIWILVRGFLKKSGNFDVHIAETPKFESDITDINYLEYIFMFIERDPPLNQTSAGYFQKLLNSLINKRGFDVFYFNFYLNY